MTLHLEWNLDSSSIFWESQLLFGLMIFGVLIFNRREYKLSTPQGKAALRRRARAAARMT